MSKRGTSFQLRERLILERDLLRTRVDQLETGILVFIRYLEAHNDAHKHNGELAALRKVLESSPETPL
jgi:hypothetical protein